MKKFIFDFVIAFILAYFCAGLIEVYNPFKEFFTRNNANKFIIFLNKPIPFWAVCMFFILFVGFYFLSKRFLHSAKKRRQLKKENTFIASHKYIAMSDEITVKTKIFFDENGDLDLDTITPYCTKHNPRQLMTWNSFGAKACPLCNNKIGGSPSYSGTTALREMKDFVFSNLEQKWEALNSN